ncbi:MAG: hypothetical protein N0E48_08405, partial [Candidatus Thiodiazotropha endolucinida]|nr:hypothetical protein [Candidatus Thiodiazotropha taylori]MCW4343367.1 hypothetical protein [Candidatus Thiodiazotropha endolucinida]
GLKEPIGSVLQTASSGSQLKPPALPGDTYYHNTCKRSSAICSEFWIRVAVHFSGMCNSVWNTQLMARLHHYDVIPQQTSHANS